MNEKFEIRQALKIAYPVMLGYLFLGIPCGLLCQKVGMDIIQVLLMCILFYSGAGQYMIPNMWLTGSPILSIAASVVLVNTRQLLYSASLSRFCSNIKKTLTFLFGATVTDESFAINIVKFELSNWSIKNAILVNIFSQCSWAIANILGVLLGTYLSVPTAMASFAMTSIFLCLLFSQKKGSANIGAAIFAALGVVFCKIIGLEGPAILIGSLFGVFVGIILSKKEDSRKQ